MDTSFGITGLKAQARAIEHAASIAGHKLVHGNVLNDVARQHGFKDWNAAVAASPPETKHQPRLTPIGEGLRADFHGADPSRTQILNSGPGDSMQGVFALLMADAMMGREGGMHITPVWINFCHKVMLSVPDSVRPDITRVTVLADASGQVTMAIAPTNPVKALVIDVVIQPWPEPSDMLTLASVLRSLASVIGATWPYHLTSAMQLILIEDIRCLGSEVDRPLGEAVSKFQGFSDQTEVVIGTHSLQADAMWARKCAKGPRVWFSPNTADAAAQMKDRLEGRAHLVRKEAPSADELKSAKQNEMLGHVSRLVAFTLGKSREDLNSTLNHYNRSTRGAHMLRLLDDLKSRRPIQFVVRDHVEPAIAFEAALASGAEFIEVIGDESDFDLVRDAIGLSRAADHRVFLRPSS